MSASRSPEPAARAEPAVFLLGISSDIGRELAVRFLGDGFRVIGTYRDRSGAGRLSDDPRVSLIPCDAAHPASVEALGPAVDALGLRWQIFISCVGTEEPIGPFFSLDFDAWEHSVIVNSTAQLRALHCLYPYRVPGAVSSAVYFAGGGTNNPFAGYSAYCVSKIMLIKMCELIDDECPDLNAFIVGPGYVRTKIHAQTLRNPAGAGANHERTLRYLATGDGTSHDDIYACIRWGIAQGRPVAGGRNFSVVHDPWRNGGAELADRLIADPNAYRLRRHGN